MASHWGSTWTQPQVTGSCSFARSWAHVTSTGRRRIGARAAARLVPPTTRLGTIAPGLPRTPRSIHLENKSTCRRMKLSLRANICNDNLQGPKVAHVERWLFNVEDLQCLQIDVKVRKVLGVRVNLILACSTWARVGVAFLLFASCPAAVSSSVGRGRIGTRSVSHCASSSAGFRAITPVSPSVPLTIDFEKNQGRMSAYCFVI